MRLPDPYTNSLAPGFNAAKLGDIDPHLVDEMPNGTVLKLKSAAQYWTLDLEYPDLTEEEYQILITALAQAKNIGDTIDVLLPQYEKYRVQGDTNSLVIAPGQSGNWVTIENTSILTGSPYIGDLLQFTNHSKVYKILAITKLATTWNIQLYPNLAKETEAGTKPIFNSILFNTTLVTDNLPTEDPSIDGFYRGVTLALREQSDA